MDGSRKLNLAHQLRLSNSSNNYNNSNNAPFHSNKRLLAHKQVSCLTRKRRRLCTKKRKIYIFVWFYLRCVRCSFFSFCFRGISLDLYCSKCLVWKKSLDARIDRGANRRSGASGGKRVRQNRPLVLSVTMRQPPCQVFLFAFIVQVAGKDHFSNCSSTNNYVGENVYFILYFCLLHAFKFKLDETTLFLLNIMFICFPTHSFIPSD